MPWVTGLRCCGRYDDNGPLPRYMARHKIATGVRTPVAGCNRFPVHRIRDRQHMAAHILNLQRQCIHIASHSEPLQHWERESFAKKDIRCATSPLVIDVHWMSMCRNQRFSRAHENRWFSMESGISHSFVQYMETNAVNGECSGVAQTEVLGDNKVTWAPGSADGVPPPRC